MENTSLAKVDHIFHEANHTPASRIKKIERDRKQ